MNIQELKSNKQNINNEIEQLINIKNALINDPAAKVPTMREYARSLGIKSKGTEKVKVRKYLFADMNAKEAELNKEYAIIADKLKLLGEQVTDRDLSENSGSKLSISELDKSSASQQIIHSTELMLNKYSKEINEQTRKMVTNQNEQTKNLKNNQTEIFNKQMNQIMEVIQQQNQSIQQQQQQIQQMQQQQVKGNKTTQQMMQFICDDDDAEDHDENVNLADGTGVRGGNEQTNLSGTGNDINNEHNINSRNNVHRSSITNNNKHSDDENNHYTLHLSDVHQQQHSHTNLHSTDVNLQQQLHTNDGGQSIASSRPQQQINEIQNEQQKQELLNEMKLKEIKYDKYNDKLNKLYEKRWKISPENKPEMDQITEEEIKLKRKMNKKQIEIDSIELKLKQYDKRQKAKQYNDQSINYVQMPVNEENEHHESKQIHPNDVITNREINDEQQQQSRQMLNDDKLYSSRIFDGRICSRANIFHSVKQSVNNNNDASVINENNNQVLNRNNNNNFNQAGNHFACQQTHQLPQILEQQIENTSYNNNYTQQEEQKNKLGINSILNQENKNKQQQTMKDEADKIENDDVVLYGFRQSYQPAPQSERDQRLFGTELDYADPKAGIENNKKAANLLFLGSLYDDVKSLAERMKKKKDNGQKYLRTETKGYYIKPLERGGIGIIYVIKEWISHFGVYIQQFLEEDMIKTILEHGLKRLHVVRESLRQWYQKYAAIYDITLRDVIVRLISELVDKADSNHFRNRVLQWKMDPNLNITINLANYEKHFGDVIYQINTYNDTKKATKGIPIESVTEKTVIDHFIAELATVNPRIYRSVQDKAHDVDIKVTRWYHIRHWIKNIVKKYDKIGGIPVGENNSNFATNTGRGRGYGQYRGNDRGRNNNYRGNSYRGNNYNNYRGNTGNNNYRGNNRGRNNYRGNNNRGNNYRGSNYKQINYRGNNNRGNNYGNRGTRGNNYRNNYRNNRYRGNNRGKYNYYRNKRYNQQNWTYNNYQPQQYNTYDQGSDGYDQSSQYTQQQNTYYNNGSWYRQLCLDYQKGNCRYGEKCRYQHIPSEQTAYAKRNNNDNYGTKATPGNNNNGNTVCAIRTDSIVESQSPTQQSSSNNNNTTNNNNNNNANQTEQAQCNTQANTTNRNTGNVSNNNDNNGYTNNQGQRGNQEVQFPRHQNY